MTLRAEGVTLHFGGVVAVNGMGINVAAGEIVGLIGPNGAGKTTFINCIAGTYRPSAGSIVWRGEQLVGLAPHALIRLGVARTFQNVTSLHDLTVMDLVKLGANMRDDLTAQNRLVNMFRSEKLIEEELRETLLAPLRLADVANKPIQTLSYGQRKAVDLARALASRPELLLLDEPVAGLTSQEGMAMAAVIRGVRDRYGCAVLMVEHRMDVVLDTCERIAVMAAGSKIFEGSGAEVQSHSEVRRVYLGEA